MREQIFSTGVNGDLLARIWSGDDASRGTLILVHGLGDHSGRYERLAKQVVMHGWSLCGYDLPGHGRSPGKRGRTGSYDQLLADLSAVRDHLLSESPGVPHVILGNSMGGNLVLNYLLRREHFGSNPIAPTGIILSSPMILPPGNHQRPEVLAAWLTGHLFPRRRIHKPTAVEKLTSDHEQAREHKDDPLTHSRIGLKLGTQLLAQGRWALDHAREVDVPTLVMHGSEDDLIDQAACEHLSIRIGELAQYKVWPGLRHELYHDVTSDLVVDYLVQWLKQFITNADDTNEP